LYVALLREMMLLVSATRSTDKLVCHHSCICLCRSNIAVVTSAVNLQDSLSGVYNTVLNFSGILCPHAHEKCMLAARGPHALR